jgi:hypothetical protein
MLLQRSKLAAASVERPRLIQPWMLLILATLVVLTLVALFPFQVLVERVIASGRGDPLTTAYLRNLLRTDPDNPELRYTLARQQLAGNLLAEARATLGPVLRSEDPAARAEAQWIVFQIARRELQNTRSDADSRPARVAALRRELRALAPHAWTETVQMELAQQALAMGETDVAASLFDRLGARRTELGADWYARAAAIALGQGEYRFAARLLLVSRERARSLAGQRQYFLEALRTLQSGNLLAEALETAETHMGDLADDPETLYYVVELARAAGRPDLADKYVRRLLRIALLRQMLPASVAALQDFELRRTAAGGQGKSPGPQLPFDDRAYRLGYEVFVASGKLEDAYQVAAAAVRQAPEDLDWRLRLARVAEWTGRPVEALEQWRVLARQASSDEAWDAVLRLAPGLFDDEAFLEALQHRLDRTIPDERRVQEVVTLYERNGEPVSGLRYLEGLYRRHPSPWLLESMARLAQRAGQENRALALWRQLEKSAGLTPAQAMEAASLWLLRGRPAEAFAMLDAARSAAGNEDAGFWRMYGDLALGLQDTSSARSAFERLAGGAHAQPADFDMLIDLLQPTNRQEAAQVAERAWRRFGTERHLILALNLWAGERRWPEVRRLLAGLSADEVAAAERQPEFLRLRAELWIQSGQPAWARRDLERALRLDPASTPAREALIWLIIDSDDAQALKTLLAEREDAWRGDRGLADALAAAHQALGQVQISLDRYLTPALPEKRDDFLWLMNYADALEQNSDPDRAWRLREYLWRQAWRKGFVVGEPQVAEARRVARARLAVSQSPGDPELVLLRELLRADRDAPASPALQELVLSWFQNQGEYLAERGYLWERYARSLSKPLWAEITAALQLDDQIAVGELLERYGERLPRYDRVNAARRVGDVRLAQSLAFDSQTVQPQDDETHLQLSEALLDYSNWGGLRLIGRRLGVLDELESAASARFFAAPDLALSLDAGLIARSLQDAQTFAGVPDEQFVQAALLWNHRDLSQTRLSLGTRKSEQRYYPALLEHDEQIDGRLTALLAVGSELPATESLGVRVAGMKDQVQAGLRFQASRLDRFLVQWSGERYTTQDRHPLGSGNRLDLSYAYALRLEPRDLELSAFFTDFRFRQELGTSPEDLRAYVPLAPPALRDLLAAIEAGTLPPGETAQSAVDEFTAAAGSVLPQSARYYGLRVSTNTRFQTDYTRAWRPFASAALTNNSALGLGYDFLLGIAGSIFGADHLQASFYVEKGGDTSFPTTRVLALSYRLHF